MGWMLRRLLRDDHRRAMEDEIAELYELRRRRDGEQAANRWRRRQRILLPVHLLTDAARAAGAAAVHAVPSIARDVARSARRLIRTPALTATIVLTVGLGLGATAGLLALVDGVLLKPLPYRDPDALFWIYTDNPPYRFRFSVVDYRALDADHPAFSAIAGYQTGAVTIAVDDRAERDVAKSVTGSYFPLLGQRAVLGRLFDPGDDVHRDRIAVLTSSYWQQRFGSDPAVLGKRIDIDGTPHSIVGVLQADVGPLERGVAVFTAARWPEPQRKGPFFTMAIARLRPGVSQAQAAATLHATNRRLFPIWKSSYQDERATWNLQSLHSRVVGDVGPMLFVVLAAVGVVLLIACANAMTLLIARALTRGRELAIRAALGASRGRLVRELLVESAVLAAGAALVGVGIASLTLSLAVAYGADYIPRVDEVRLTAAAIGWLAALAAASGLLIALGSLGSLSPGTARGLDAALRSSSRGSTEAAGARQLRRLLVAGEFALATPLVVASALVLASLARLSTVDVGIDMSRVLTAQISLPSNRYDEPVRAEFWRRAIDRLARVPGVQAVAIADSRPPAEAGNLNNFDLEDRPTPPGENQPIATWVAVSPAFFDAVGLTLVQGRGLDERSLDANEVVVDGAWARRFFPGEPVVGRRLRSGGCTTCPLTTVIGVVDTVKWQGLDAVDEGTVYSPFVDFPRGFIFARTTGDPFSLAAGLRTAVRDLDPGLAVADVASGPELVATSIAQPRSLTVVFGIFAVTAVALSVVGIYGVMAYFVEQRRREIGIRIALGGHPRSVRRMVLGQGVQLVAIGVTVGIVAAFTSARWLTSMLFEISATDSRILVAAAVVLLVAAALASLGPARRAAAIDPATLLRDS